jgi:hypothetical protein
VTQRPVPVTPSGGRWKTTNRRPAPVPTITAVIPFILILMTITGAVYPAIDLTAGDAAER